MNVGQRNAGYLENGKQLLEGTTSIERPALEMAMVAIVTGGRRELGRNTVHHIACRDISSTFTYRSNQAEADEAVAAVIELGSKAIALRLDTGSVPAFDRFVDAV